ncbi:hypothetical protein QBC42DRAFT_259717 [Cladorrhinum samala]|uniref:Integron gene cassette protein n=1 Tax=Cladorrhinum samala TaxID=585594 RepID=A0AAV9I3Z2_9PEZI|nr:hypothetical protein QBC42DRAFT_259717 [Cladorrhinum samala]
MNQPEPSGSNAGLATPQQPVIIGRTRLHGATEDQEEVAFYVGQECSYSLITKFGGAACGIPFTLAGQVYTWEGCGGPIWVQSADSATQPPWHGDCTWIPDFEPVDCGQFDVRAGWSCG